MKNRYEAFLALNAKGSDEGAKDLIERLEGEFKSEGAEVEQVQKMDRRQLSYVAGALDSAYFVNFIFRGEPATVDRLKARLRLDEEVYRAHYQKLRAKVERPKKVAKKS